ncbi:hypothetical protein [Halomonas sp. MCCC 1A11062]|uniref:hypothetical protein n=1 Tax=Halomonas sp. MCCC 1A11062 TaxID=2733485 RepID=UPI001F30492F|nr:hypothetical protein [Halomonas sp. MCCC 1A11062]MCE8036118.1 hypothetical protein [Halomonas sp. MCCC 1A11062]
MMSAIKYFVLVAVVLFSISISADENYGEEEAVIELFFEYLAAYSDSDFHKAATFVHPQHLRDYEKYTLPVLIEAKNHPLSSQHMIVEVFFEGVPDEKIYEITGAEISARLDRAMVRFLPVIIESARLENISIKSVEFLNENRARVSYDYHPEDGGVEEIEDNFAKYYGAWRILLPESPKQASESLKSLFE